MVFLQSTTFYFLSAHGHFQINALVLYNEAQSEPLMKIFHEMYDHQDCTKLVIWMIYLILMEQLSQHNNHFQNNSHPTGEQLITDISKNVFLSMLYDPMLRWYITFAWKCKKTSRIKQKNTWIPDSDNSGQKHFLSMSSYFQLLRQSSMGVVLYLLKISKISLHSTIEENYNC